MTRKYTAWHWRSPLARRLGRCRPGGQEVRFTCAYDGNGCEILKDILARYEKQHPDVKIVTDVVPTRHCWKAARAARRRQRS